MLIGVIADDFTGATDIAGFLVSEGLRTVQLGGVPTSPLLLDVDAAVVSLKSRSCPVPDAIEQSVAALRWLKDQGAQQIFFKYCSTFDSTAQGNIGPVTDALMAELGTPITVITPSLPINGRDVFNGNLFVLGVPLNESGMRNHPVNPMTDANLMRLMERQATGRCGLINWQCVEQGSAAVRTALEQAQAAGFAYVVTDAFRETHLHVLGEALRDLPLVTGGSGLGAGLARAWACERGLVAKEARQAAMPVAGPAVVLSGSCSEMTNRQVAHYRELAPALALSVEACLTRPDHYVDELVIWVVAHLDSSLAPLLYATAAANELKAVQERFGAEAASHAVERCFASVAARLREQGVTRFIVAGGETSGSVTQALGVSGLQIGPQIAPGVPWVRSLDGSLSLALKSGNFGQEAFFSHAQELCHD